MLSVLLFPAIGLWRLRRTTGANEAETSIA
jgi:hypothetical protein